MTWESFWSPNPPPEPVCARRWTAAKRASEGRVPALMAQASDLVEQGLPLQAVGTATPASRRRDRGCSCKVLGIDWDRGDHSMRHRGEREPGQTVMRWTIPPYDFDDEDE